MEQACQECKQKAEFICFCNDYYLCKGCRETHKRKFKGPHRILLFNDPDIEELRNQFKGNNKLLQKNSISEIAPEAKKVEDPPALAQEKFRLRQVINNEIEGISKFKGNIIEQISSQAKDLVKEVIGKYEIANNEFLVACSEKEKELVDALEHLNYANDVSSNRFLCKMLDYSDLMSVELLSLRSTVHEKSVTLQNSLDFSIELSKFEETNQVLEYFNTNKDLLLPPIKALFDDILNERHFKVTVIKLVKVPLNKEGGTQLSIVLNQFPALKVLHLSENELGPDGIKRLIPLISSIKSLKKLTISKNLLKGNGGKSLASCLKELKELTSLDLSGNKLGLEGLKHISNSLYSLTKLKSLKLVNNSLGNDCINQLIPAISSLKKLKSLRLTGNNFHANEQNAIEEHVPNKCSVKF